ncbi:2-(1,2-epoxy-1,2-dihydrophenyl)acetyl-CoA isomerase [Pontibacter ummariensis]|uniref:2-(1,2-epoxy-1,2-dihydrophenyl)acetyl-CoA isomerase n=1 Tax=Pontibacter ummariensis TaxID=1610492 RepID=A0A239KZM5_9BACT|nr:enoyl-CoA hydratase-related protein [Pontibacter ummariensis]PRY04670.1 2-(1,2-epoxy-1,2-dihydrophenyl)acetyl-CoA isomerase [Pontibacter ummariensis]SNT23043.1 2-(1,2-epoxy-1,2-dihydrophenyl)acetyl-CoA isomerase [Pontibacter ummariensis]
MKESTYIKFSLEGGVATLTLNRPDVFNSFNREMAMALQEHLRACQQKEEVRAVLLTGEGKAFCAGQDLAEATDENGPEISEIVVKHYNPIITLIRGLEKPVIAAVNGVAAGAGANIALACDIVVAKESASFIQAFSKIGLIPDSAGTFFLPRLVGLQRASALMMTGDKVSAKEALEMGMIYKTFPDESFEAEVSELVQRMAKMPTKGLAYTKQLLNCTFSFDLKGQLDNEATHQHKAGQTEDFKEGVQAFIEKRKPNFKGQ